MSSIYLCNGWWYYQTYLDSPTGKRKTQRSLKTKDKVLARRQQKEWDKKYLHDQIRLINRIPWNECVTTYLNHRTRLTETGQLSRNTLRSDVGSLKVFSGYFEDTGRKLYLNDFENPDQSIEILQSYITHRQNGNISPNTIRRDLRHLSILFTFFIRPPHRLLVRNPVSEITLPRPTRRVEIPKPRDWMLLRDTLRDRMRKGSTRVRDEVLFVMCETGCRISELLLLKWSQGPNDVSGSGSQWGFVDLQEKQFRIYSKRLERVVPYGQFPQLSSFFRRSDLNRRSETWVFPSPRTGRPLNLSQFNRSFKNLQTELGIKKQFSSHGIRHGFISYLVNSSIPSDQIGWLVGHTSSEITRTYSHPDIESLGKILSVLK